jgi:hypothetical protein
MSTKKRNKQCSSLYNRQDNETSVTASGVAGKASTIESNKRCSERHRGQHINKEKQRVM